WKRTSAHSAARRWGDVHDTLLFYTASDDYVWNQVLTEHSEEYTARYKHVDGDGKRWADDNLTGPGTRGGSSGESWRGFDVTSKGSEWKVRRKAVEEIVCAEQAAQMSTIEKLDLLDEHGLIDWPKSTSGG